MVMGPKMHRIAAILIVVVLTCFLSIGNNTETTNSTDRQILLDYNDIIIENYDNIYSMSVAELLSEGGSNNAMKDIIR